MEAVDELEAESDQQRDSQQHEGADRHRRSMRRVDVGEQPAQRVADADREQNNEDNGGRGVRPGVEVRPRRQCRRDGFGHDDPLVLFIVARRVLALARPTISVP